MSGIAKQVRRFLYHRILHADDTPHRIALGVGLATFVAFTPLLGFHTVIALAVAAAFRANKAVCIPLVWITNPLTAGPVYWFCWRIGSGLLPASGTASVRTVVHRLAAAWHVDYWSQLVEWGFWSNIFAILSDLGKELWLGCCLVGFISGGVLYGLTIWGVTVYRRRRADRKMRRDANRTGRFLRQARAKRAVGLHESV